MTVQCAAKLAAQPGRSMQDGAFSAREHALHAPA